MTGTMFDVIIAGFGPSGAVAAGLLGARGFRVLVVERQRKIYDKPRAIAVDHEIMRLFDNMGIAEAVLPFVAPFTASEHYGAESQLIRRIDMVARPYPLGYIPSMVFTQPPVEAVLRTHANSFDCVTVSLGSEVIAAHEADDGVAVEMLDEGGVSRHLHARYLLGCDGASSTVRQLAGIALTDLIFDEPWLVVDVLCGPAALEKLPRCSAQFCTPARPTTFIIGPKNHRRWEIMLLPGENPCEMEQPEKVWQLLAPFMAPEEGELWRAAAYRFHALVAERWRRGRILIAGDAAHQQPPFIGQGMCQGLRDVSNLAWKLTRVLTGESQDSLLDSYETERKRHVKTLTGKIKAIGQSICERDPEKAAQRDAEILELGGGEAQRLTRQEIVPPLETGLLAQASAGRGRLFPQPMILHNGQEILLDRIAGTGWRLVLDARCLTMVDAGAAELPGLAVLAVGQAPEEGVLVEREGVLAAWFDSHEAVAALVRPDHYVFGTAPDGVAAGALVAELRRYLA